MLIFTKLCDKAFYTLRKCLKFFTVCGDSMLLVIALRAIVFGIFLHEVAMMLHFLVAKKHFVEFRDDMNGELAVTEN